jgi:hypothetical protein
MRHAAGIRALAFLAKWFSLSAVVTTHLLPEQQFATNLDSLRQALWQHRLYQQLQTLDDLSVFMEMHVYAVWDFMSLLKALQGRLTCVSTPWMPERQGKISRLVNEIVLGEESDALPDGGAMSHYELYLQAMKEVGADAEGIEQFLNHLRAGGELKEAMIAAAVSDPIQDFMDNTFAVIQRGQSHEIAAAFTYGREDLIPELFTQLVHRLDAEFPGRLATFRYYLERHIELDGDEHGAMGREMVALLCGACEQKQRQAEDAAISALQARLRLWDAISRRLDSR